MQYFAVAFVGRVGSSFLEGLLNSHPDAACFGEIVSHPPRSVESAEQIAEHIDQVMHSADASVAGFKLPFCSVPLPAGILDTLSARDCRFVHIQRRNKLDQFLSMRLAQVNNAWRSDDGAYEVEQLYIDPAEAISCIRKFISYEILIEETLSGRFPYHQVVYEEVVTGEALPGVLDFLGLEPRPLTSVFLKQRQASQRYTIANYDEVAAAIRRSGFRRFLDRGRAHRAISAVLDRYRR